MQVIINPQDPHNITFVMEGEPMSVEEVHACIRELTGKEPVGNWEAGYWSRDMIYRELRSQGHFDRPHVIVHATNSGDEDGDDHSHHLPVELAHYPLITVPSNLLPEPEAAAPVAVIPQDEPRILGLVEYDLAKLMLPNPFFNGLDVIYGDHASFFGSPQSDGRDIFDHEFGHEMGHGLLEPMMPYPRVGNEGSLASLIWELEYDRLGRLYTMFEILSRLTPDFDIETGTVVWSLRPNDGDHDSEDDRNLH